MAGPKSPFERGVSRELIVTARIRSLNSTAGAGTAWAVVPSKGRLSRVQIAFDGDPSADWVANIVTPRGTATGALTLAQFGGAAAIADADSLEWSLDPMSDLFDLSRGDVIRVVTATASGSATSGYVNFVLGG